PVFALENRDGARLLPRNSLKAGSALLALYISMALLVVGMTSEVFVPLFLQVLHQQTPLLAGYIAALMAAGWTLGAIFSSGLGPRGAARAIAIGPFLVVAGLLLACLFMPAT
ncbi:MFS transporter, partial [Pseudomonas sp. SIMBA_077]